MASAKRAPILVTPSVSCSELTYDPMQSITVAQHV
jgi:hypothetical protein